jgi:glycosyltransferase involved in cell wall biosynthesis
MSIVPITVVHDTRLRIVVRIVRVLTISNLYPPHGYGGYEWTCFDAMTRFVDAGHDVEILTTDTAVTGATPVDEPRVRRDLRAWWNWAHQTEQRPGLRGAAADALHNHRALCRALDDVRPDVVSVWHMGGLGTSLLTEVERRGLPMAAVIEDDWLVYNAARDYWVAHCREHPVAARLTARMTGVPTSLPSFETTMFAFASEFTRQRALRDGSWAVRSSAVVPLGVATRDFPILDRSPGAWQWRLLYVGRMEPQKGVETLLRAVAELPSNVQLDLVGGGNEGYRAMLRDVVTELGLEQRVRFQTVNRSDLAPRYVASDAVVFPSEWDEPFGLVPLEAMACGVPVVATGTGGSGEYLVDGGNCLLYPPGDVAALAGALRTLATDDALRALLVREGRETAGRLTAGRFADEVLRLHLTTAAEARRELVR